MVKKYPSGTSSPGFEGQEVTNWQKCELWKSEEFDTLIHILSEEHNLGQQAENGFKEESYQQVVDTLRNQHYFHGVAQVKSAWSRVYSVVVSIFTQLHGLTFSGKQCKANYKVVRTLCQLSGFEWDDTKKLVMAEKQVWDVYLEVCNSECSVFEPANLCVWFRNSRNTQNGRLSLSNTTTSVCLSMNTPWPLVRIPSSVASQVVVKVIPW